MRDLCDIVTELGKLCRYFLDIFEKQTCILQGENGLEATLHRRDYLETELEVMERPLG